MRTVLGALDVQLAAVGIGTDFKVASVRLADDVELEKFAADGEHFLRLCRGDLQKVDDLLRIVCILLHRHFLDGEALPLFKIRPHLVAQDEVLIVGIARGLPGQKQLFDSGAEIADRLFLFEVARLVALAVLLVRCLLDLGGGSVRRQAKKVIEILFVERLKPFFGLLILGERNGDIGIVDDLHAHLFKIAERAEELVLRKVGNGLVGDVENVDKFALQKRLARLAQDLDNADRFLELECLCGCGFLGAAALPCGIGTARGIEHGIVAHHFKNVVLQLVEPPADDGAARGTERSLDARFDLALIRLFRLDLESDEVIIFGIPEFFGRALCLYLCHNLSIRM